MDPISTIIFILIAIAIDIVAYMLMPKPKQPKPAPNVKPQVSAGVPVSVVFGSVTISDPEILWYGDQAVTKVMVGQ